MGCFVNVYLKVTIVDQHLMGSSGLKSWVDWLLTTSYGTYFVKIDDGYLNNVFNYYGLRQKVPYFKYAYDLIRGPYLDPKERPKEWPKDMDSYGLCLYGLLHARYLLTTEGQNAMLVKYNSGKFPHCPRTLCRGTCCLPYGSSDNIGQTSIQMFCPNCNDIYSINDEPSNFTDGAFFGPSWVHSFLKHFPHLVPSEQPEKYVPRIFGFRVAT